MRRVADSRDGVPTLHCVGGVALRPFSLGHHLLLRKLSMPYAGNADADCDSSEIVIGVIICALPYDTALEYINGGKFHKIIRQWRRRIQGFWFNRPSMLDVEAGFRDYLREGYSLPPLWKHPTVTGVSLTAPWEHMLKVKLCSVGFSEREVLTGYLPARWYDYYAAIEWDQASECEDAKKWRKIFFTQQHAEEMGLENG